MKSRLIILATIVAALVGAALGAAPAQAGDIAPKPIIDKSKGECVAPPGEMRRNHMKYLLHQRDETMYRGVRGKKTSLRACLNCHEVKGDDGKPVTIKSEKHFCRTCHDFAAVKVDCWSCHASVPDKAAGAAALKLPGRNMRASAAGLKKYLEGGDK